MPVVLTRRVLIASIAFVVTACGGPASTSVAPANQPLGTSRAPQAASSRVVHRGVPFAIGSSHGPALRAQGDYPTEHPLLFVSNQSAAAVAVFSLRLIKHNRNPIAQLASTSGCPYGIAEDKHGSIYVVQNCPPDGNVVDVFPKGSTSPSRQITDGISNPLGAAIDAKGDLYVSNSPAAITVYPPGASSPSQTITGGGMSAPFGLAFDKNGNLFIADFGADQLVYSTDYPHGDSRYPRATESFLELPICDDDKRKILWDNCARFYGVAEHVAAGKKLLLEQLDAFAAVGFAAVVAVAEVEQVDVPLVGAVV